MVIRLQGSQQFRHRLVCATLAGTTISVEDIRASEQPPGVRAHEVSLLRLIEKISNGCTVQINETGTRLRYKPGVIVGGKHIVHDCGVERAIGYYLEALVVLALFGKKPIAITLKGVTNDDRDLTVDTFRTTTLPLLKHFGVPTEELELKIVKRGAPPLGGGEVVLKVPVVQALTPVHWVEEGMVKRIRGVAYSTRVSPQMSSRMVDSVRGILNALLPDVYIFTDHYTGQESGRSPGYGVSLVAETTSGCLISSSCSAETTNSAEGEEEGEREVEGDTKSTKLLLPEDIGQYAAKVLVQEVRQGGVVDSSHQGVLFLLCALCPEDVSKVRVGPLSPHAIRVLRDIKLFFGVQFNISPEPTTGTVLLSCVGSGLKNLSRKVS